MKKILLALTLATGLSFAASAQSSNKTSGTTSEPAKVEVAGQVTKETTVVEPTTATPTESGTPAKSCCSAKKGKETAETKTKSCCSDGKKSKAHCSDKKEESTISQ